MKNTKPVDCPGAGCAAGAVEYPDGTIVCNETREPVAITREEAARAEALAAAIKGRPAGMTVSDVLRRGGAL